jgi:hypothetical protein
VLSDSNETGHRQSYLEFIFLAGLNRLAACSTGTKHANLPQRRLMDGKSMLGGKCLWSTAIERGDIMD